MLYVIAIIIQGRVFLEEIRCTNSLVNMTFGSREKLCQPNIAFKQVKLNQLIEKIRIALVKELLFQSMYLLSEEWESF